MNLMKKNCFASSLSQCILVVLVLLKWRGNVIKYMLHAATYMSFWEVDKKSKRWSSKNKISIGLTIEHKKEFFIFVKNESLKNWVFSHYLTCHVAMDFPLLTFVKCKIFNCITILLIICAVLGWYRKLRHMSKVAPIFKSLQVLIINNKR